MSIYWTFANARESPQSCNLIHPGYLLSLDVCRHVRLGNVKQLCDIGLRFAMYRHVELKIVGEYLLIIHYYHPKR